MVKDDAETQPLVGTQEIAEAMERHVEQSAAVDQFVPDTQIINDDFYCHIPNPNSTGEVGCRLIGCCLHFYHGDFFLKWFCFVFKGG